MAIFLKLLYFALLASCFHGTNSQQPLPNIILLLMDDLGWGDLGFNGYGLIKETPNIDRMAKEGLIFKDFYSASSSCSASRASLLTGRLPYRNGFYTSNSIGLNSHMIQAVEGGISSEDTLISELLNQKKYRNKIIGRWDLGHSKPIYHPLQNGFHEYYGAPNFRSGPYDNKNSPNIPVFMDENMIGRFYENIFIDHKKKISNLTEIYTDQAIQFINKQANTGKPFFLYWAPDNLHAPTFRSAKFALKSLKLSSYGDALKEIDHSIGQILNTVRNNARIKENTLVFFTSDNGASKMTKNDGGSNGPFLCGKYTTFEGGFRVPGIAWWPSKIKGPRTTKRVSSTMDLYSTFAKLARVQTPYNQPLDSVDLTPILFDEDKKPKDGPIFYYRGNLLMAIRVGAYKAHYHTWTSPSSDVVLCRGASVKGVTTSALTDHKNPILFNLEKDPGELNPIPVGAGEYMVAVDSINQVRNKHLKELKPATAILNMCSSKAMNWAPPGCKSLNMCLPVQTGKSFSCKWAY